MYLNILRNFEFTNKTSYEDFCYARRKEMLLYVLILMYYNIPTSSAYVERFFSICGIVNRKRAGNMKWSNKKKKLNKFLLNFEKF